MDQVSRETINKQEEEVARVSYLQGNVAMFESFKNALRFLSQNDYERNLNYDFRENDLDVPDKLQAIIVLSVQNYNSFKYFRMNREKYSAYS